MTREEMIERAKAFAKSYTGADAFAMMADFAALETADRGWREIAGRLEDAERMIYGALYGGVKLGVKAQQFFGEYAVKYPEPFTATRGQGEGKI